LPSIGIAKIAKRFRLFSHKSQKIRMKLGGSGNMLDDFPSKPKGMHQRTDDRLRRVRGEIEESRMIGLARLVEGLSRQATPA
jgi:hypothetical protein